ncbi:MAG: hypothetical protein ACM3S4_00665 [Burkholderiales bacterium]
MKSVAALFFAITLLMALAIAFGSPWLNELQVISPDEQAQERTIVGSAKTFIIGVMADCDTYEIIMRAYRTGLSAETEQKS